MSDNKDKSTFKSLLPNKLTASHDCCPEKSKHDKQESCSMHDYPGHFSSVIDYPPQFKEKRRSSITFHNLPIKKDCGCGK